MHQDSSNPADEALSQAPTAEQGRLTAILGYLEDWEKLTKTLIGNVKDYDSGFVAFEDEVAGIPDIELNLVSAEEDVWMAIPRLKRLPPPIPQGELSPWVILANDPAKEPQRREFKDLPSNDPDKTVERVYFKDNENLESLYKRYCEQQWLPWSTREKERRECISLYEKLFQVQQSIETSSETPIELVWGMGMAAWQHPSGKVFHPIVTQQVEVLPLDDDMTLRVRPTSRDPRIETDPFLPLELPELAGYESKARENLEKAEETPSPYHPSSFFKFIHPAAASLDKSGSYWPDQADYVKGASPKLGEHLVVSDSWVLFARKRDTNFLVDDLNRLKQAIVEDGVPEGAPHFLVEEAVGAVPEVDSVPFRGLSTDAAYGGPCQELFFPKPFNQEQVEIVKRLESSPGVIVQGPPGTGKTHTIANVICHYLALGKRVLVTSKGETALSVLQDQIPKGVRDLTVSLLTSERDGKDQLEKTVKRINAKLTNLQPAALKTDIRDSETQIEKLHQKLAAIDTDLRSWASKNTEPIPSHLGRMSPEALAQEVAAEESAHSWFPDKLDDRAGHDPEASEEDLRVLASARRRLGANLQYVDTTLPCVETLPSAAHVSMVHECLCEKEALKDTVHDDGLPRLSATDEEALEAANKLHTEITSHRKLATQCSEDWLAAIRMMYRDAQISDDGRPLINALDSLLAQIEPIREGLAAFVATAVDLPQDWMGEEKLITAIQRASEGKRPFGLLSVGSGSIKDSFHQIRINGAKPSSADEWAQIATYTNFISKGVTLTSQWNKLRLRFEGPAVEGEAEQAASILSSTAKAVEDAKQLGSIYDRTLSDRVRALFPQISPHEIEPSDHFLARIDKALRVQLRHQQLASSEETVKQLRSLSLDHTGELFHQLNAWQEHWLGKTGHPASEIEKEWATFLGTLARLHALHEEFGTVRRVTAMIERSGATHWASRLRTEPSLAEKDPLTPSNWASSWLWSRQRGFLQAIDGRAEILQLATARRDAVSRLAGAYESVSENRTWLRLEEQLRLDRAILRGITSYVQAIRDMTMSGKGKRDGKLRHAARVAMQDASRGVPCWIMPHWRVSEALPAELGKFDLVIVDEASQSDAWAVPAIVRGKKILIVGDDKQVGPKPSFTRQEQIDQIQERLKIEDVPLDVRTCLDPKKSIYDLGELIFSGQTIRLREHFRCAEPIIEFSNKLCYDNEIKCVRVPNAQERLLPTLVDVHVKTGRREGSAKINEPEAQAIVDEIEVLIADPAFEGRSIGVVSLLGDHQAKVIHKLLLDTIGEELFLQHHIRCGDARVFQGSERDVIFISCVDDGNGTGKRKSPPVMTLNNLDNIRRINVAVSRARDRLYVFHSFARDDLSELDLRGRLLDHFQAPIQGLSDKQGIDLCESGFERAMFEALTDKGYRVIPQVPAGNYRIDFVVEGNDGKRLAIECDGDRYHGPDKWMEDTTRQRVLERAGWKFWRCWGSSFIRDKEGCLKDLIQTLDSEEIEPIGADDADYSGLVEFRTIEFEEDEQVNPDDTEFEEKELDEVMPEEPALKDDLPFHDSEVSHESTTDPEEVATVEQRVSVGDSVRYQIHDEHGAGEEDYVMILDEPTNLKLGILNANAPVAQYLLGREEGDVFKANLAGRSVDIVVLKHEARNSS